MVSSRAAGPDLFPSCSIALVPHSLTLQTPGEELGPVTLRSRCLGCTCASSRACSERLQKGSQGLAGFASGRARWRLGSTWGSSERAFCSFPPSRVFPFLCQQLLSCEDLISPVQRVALGTLGHRPRMRLAGIFSFFFFFLAPISQETFRACLVSP